MAHRNAEFYFQDIVLRVEDELFKVSQNLFVQHSQVFRDMFNMPQPEGIEPDGSSDERPLILEGIEKQEFIQLLRFLYPQFQKAPGRGFSLDQWKSVLKLSNLYGMIEVKNLIVAYMTPLLKAESPSLQIHLAKVHDVPKWLQPAKTRLVERSNPIDENDVRLIGPTFALEVCALREKALREKALQEKTLLENALKEKKLLGTALREKKLLGTALREKKLLGTALREKKLLGTALREKKLLGTALREKKLLGTALRETAQREKVLQEMLSAGEKSKKNKLKPSSYDWD